ATSYWIDNATVQRFSSLKQDLAVDALVVGGGITGITAAYLLKRAGRTVALVERDRCISGDTVQTTAHLTCVTDIPLVQLVEEFGPDHARAAWDAGFAAIDQINTIVWREQIKCQFAWLPAYLFQSGRADANPRPIDLRREADVAAEFGFDATYEERVPVVDRPGIRYDNQAKFHPFKY